MSWYKKAQQIPIKFLSWAAHHSDEDGEMAIAYGNKRYVYKDISREEANKMSYMLGKGYFPNAAKKLKFYSNRYKKKMEQQQLTPRGHTPQEEQQMLKELENEGLLSNELV